MAELLKTRCKQGKLIITDTHIIIELGNLRSSTLARASFTSLDSKMGVPSVFGLGGGTNLTFHGQGAEILHADLVPPKDAKQVAAILTGRE